MSDDDARDIQERHLRENHAQAASPASTATVRRAIEAALRELGIDLTDWRGSVQEFKRTIDFATDMRGREAEVYDALGFVKKYRAKEEALDAALRITTDIAEGRRDLVKEGRKSLMSGAIAALFAAATAAIGYILGRGH